MSSASAGTVLPRAATRTRSRSLARWRSPHAAKPTSANTASCLRHSWKTPSPARRRLRYSRHVYRIFGGCSGSPRRNFWRTKNTGRLGRKRADKNFSGWFQSSYRAVTDQLQISCRSGICMRVSKVYSRYVRSTCQHSIILIARYVLGKCSVSVRGRSYPFIPGWRS